MTYRNRLPGNVNWLTSCPAGDINFKCHLSYASAEEIQMALSIVREAGGSDKTKIQILERALRKKEKEAQG